jgi:hypothetical protein
VSTFLRKTFFGNCAETQKTNRFNMIAMYDPTECNTTIGMQARTSGTAEKKNAIQGRNKKDAI